MTAKTAALYEEVIERIQAVCIESNRVRIDPELMISDYEMAILTAVASKFPNGRAKGCYFHLSQVIFVIIIVCVYSVIVQMNIFIRPCIGLL